jgi:hypothetical protein
VARTIDPKTTLGALPSVWRAGLLTLHFSRSSSMRRSHSARLISRSALHFQPYYSQQLTY